MCRPCPCSCWAAEEKDVNDNNGGGIPRPEERALDMKENLSIAQLKNKCVDLLKVDQNSRYLSVNMKKECTLDIVGMKLHLI